MVIGLVTPAISHGGFYGNETVQCFDIDNYNLAMGLLVELLMVLGMNKFKEVDVQVQVASEKGAIVAKEHAYVLKNSL